MEKGSFITDTFNEGNATVNMRGWVEPTAYNNGETEVYINGMKLLPKGIFRLGPSNVEMYGTINIGFPETGRREVKISYTLLQRNCTTNP